MPSVVVQYQVSCVRPNGVADTGASCMFKPGRLIAPVVQCQVCGVRANGDAATGASYMLKPGT